MPEAENTDADRALVAQTEIFDLKTGLRAVISNPFWLRGQESTGGRSISRRVW